MRIDAPQRSAEILFVDDEEALATLAREVLCELGYRVTICTSGIAALDLFRDRPDDFDLLITDLRMPDLPGDRLAEEILSIRPRLPVILVTGLGEDEGSERARACGIRRILTKPHTVRELAEKVREALNPDDR